MDRSRSSLLKAAQLRGYRAQGFLPTFPTNAATGPFPAANTARDGVRSSPAWSHVALCAIHEAERFSSQRVK